MTSHAGVGQDARQLDQPGRDVDAQDQGLERAADGPQQPQDVEVAGRVIAEVGRIVEFAGSALGQSLSPGGEVADVDPEAGQRQQHAPDQDAQEHPADDDDDEERDCVARQGEADWPRAPPHGVAGHRCRRVAHERRRVFHAKVAVSIHAGSDAPDRAGVSPTRPRSVVPYASPEAAWSAAAVALVALAIYLRTMLPSTGFWDTAEAQTVPYTLSIFHPTGFPTYTLIGWLWSQLPLGERGVAHEPAVRGVRGGRQRPRGAERRAARPWSGIGGRWPARPPWRAWPSRSPPSRGATPFAPTCTRCTSCWPRCWSGCCSSGARRSGHAPGAPAAGCSAPHWSSAWRWATIRSSA